MGNSGEEGKNAKNEIPPPSPAMNNCHVYPDWAAVQAFYGPRLAMPPYSISPVTPSPTNPHYIWAPPQSMIAPYGAPYPAFYAPYAHPGVPVVTPTMESPAKSIGKSGAVLKKHKEIDGLAISIGNGSVDDNDTPTERRRSSDSEATDGSSHGSNGGLAGTAKGRRKSSHQCSPNQDVKAQKEVVLAATEIGQASNKSIDMIPSDAPGQKSENLCTTLEIKDVKPTLSDILQPIPSETLIQNERELKRERRKQSNRESARRSRFRKQAETEELANNVQALISDNTNMKSEISTMMDRCKKLKLENAVLMGKLDNARFRQTNNLRFEPTITRLKTTPPLATVDLLARVNNGDQENDDGEVYENRTSPVKLQPLLDGSH